MARGPAYPYTDLGTAIDLLRKLHQFAKRSPANVEALAKEAWAWSPTSSTANKAIAALKYFGLIEDAGKDHKSVKISDRGYRIVVDSPESPERQKAIKEAALSPPQYAYCFKEWGAELPAAARSILMFERGFIPTTVDAFIKDYSRTMALAGLGGGPLSGADAEESESQESFQPPQAGAKMPNQPPVSNGQWLPVQASHTPTSYVGREAPDVRGVRQEVFSTDEGAVVVEWPASLSKESLEDILAWLPILTRKIKRAVREEVGPPSFSADESA